MSGEKQQGFTLIEVVLTIMLILVSTLGASVIFSGVNRNSLNGQMTSVGLELSEQKMEQIIADRSARGYSYITSANYPATEALTGAYAGFTRTTTIYEVSQADLITVQPGSGYKRIDILVSWGPTVGESVKVSSLVGNY